MKKKLVCIIGPSACGKDTIYQKVLKKSSFCSPIVRYTTRPKRDYEIEGKDYYFINNEEFTKKVLDCEMAEAAEFNNWFYGTGKDVLKEDLINIMTCDFNAAEALCSDPDLFTIVIYIEAAPKERLLRALNREKDPDVDEIIRRFIDDERKYNKDNMLALPYYSIKNNSKTQLKSAVGEVCNYINNLYNKEI